MIHDETNDSHLLRGRRGGNGVRPILRTCFNIFANTDGSKSLDFSNALLSYVIAKMLKEVRKIDCIEGGRKMQPILGWGCIEHTPRPNVATATARFVLFRMGDTSSIRHVRGQVIPNQRGGQGYVHVLVYVYLPRMYPHKFRFAKYAADAAPLFTC